MPPASSILHPSSPPHPTSLPCSHSFPFMLPLLTLFFSSEIFSFTSLTSTSLSHSSLLLCFAPSTLYLSFSISFPLSFCLSICFSLSFLPCSASVCLSLSPHSPFSSFSDSVPLFVLLSSIVHNTLLHIPLLDAPAPGSPPNKKPPGGRLLARHACSPCEISHHPLQVKGLTLLTKSW